MWAVSKILILLACTRLSGSRDVMKTSSREKQNACDSGRGGGGRLSLSPTPRVFRVSFHNRCALLSLEPETSLMFPWSFVRYPLSARSLVFYETLRAPRIEAGIRLYCFLSEDCLFTFRKKVKQLPNFDISGRYPRQHKTLIRP